MNMSLRRSERLRKNDWPPWSPANGTLFKCAQDQQQQQQDQAKLKGNQQLQPQEGKLQQEDHSVTPGHIVEAEVAGIGGVEGIPINICSSPEETKLQIDPLSLLQPVSKPNFLVKVRQESLQKIMDAAAEFKSALVSHLEELAHSLDIVQMVQSVNECFNRMRCLDVDYQAFHGEISRLIEYYQKLKEATEGNKLELEAAYKMSVIEADDVKTKLTRAENDLLNAQTNNNLRRDKIKELKETLSTLEAEEAVERNRLATLTAERDCCHKAHSCSKTKVDSLYSQLEGIITQHNATREEIRQSLSRLKGPAYYQRRNLVITSRLRGLA